MCLCVCEGFEPCTLYKPQSIIQAAAPPSRCAHGAHKAAVKGWREEEEEGNKLKVRTASCSVPLMPGCWPLASLGFIVMTFSPRLLRHCMKAALSLANKMGRWRPSQKAPPPPPPQKKKKIGWGLEIDTHLYISCPLFSSFSFLPSFLLFPFLIKKISFHTMLLNAVSYVNLKKNHVSWLLDFNILTTTHSHLRTKGGPNGLKPCKICRRCHLHALFGFFCQYSYERSTFLLRI